MKTMKTSRFQSRAAIMLFAVLLLISGHAFALTYSFTDFKGVNQVNAGAALSVQDAEYSTMTGNVNWPVLFENKKAVNRLILGIDDKNTRYQPSAYDAEVKVRITRYVWTSGTTFTPQTQDVTLKVNYTLTGAYKDKAVFQIEGGYKMDVQVLSVISSPSSAVMNLTLEAQLEIERYYNLTVNAVPDIDYKTDYVTTRNELEVSWSKVAGAEQYELEWTYVNNVSTNGMALPASQVFIDNEIFRSNNTRVSITASADGSVIPTYRIPLIYEQGFILFRVRAVGAAKQDRSRMVTGLWSSDGFTFSTVADFRNTITNKNHFYFLPAGHQDRLNWQSSVVFIEEGRNKIAVSYADGTLRGRQQVSRLNSQDETIIGESVYDNQGRKAIDIIPVPTGQQKIQYTPNFNQNINGDPYSREDFDKDATGNNCDLSAGPLATTSGASQYYGQRTDAFGADQYIPDAQGFPMVQTVYTNDNTGRVSAQGGIGVDHQIGSGHETKNFYGKPLQVELDRMFGAEAGYASHYQKNLVVDPNGQVTVTYLDLKGNVVATALAGNSPVNLQALDGNQQITISEDLLTPDYDANGKLIEKQYYSPDGMSKIYSQELLVSTAGERTFTYNIDPQKLQLSCQVGETVNNFCFDCALNVEILITDKCGQQYFLDQANLPVNGVKIGPELLSAIQNEQVVSITNCNRQVASYNVSDAPYLKVGDYTIRKVVTVNQQVMEYYTQQYMAQGCFKTLDDFLGDNIALVDTNSCNDPCGVCLDKIGSYDQYDINVTPNCDPCLSFEEYQEQKNECAKYCNDSPVNCESMLGAMKIDVSPMGQYGDIFDANGVVSPDDVLSVFRSDNLLPINYGQTSGNEKFWKHPEHFEKSGADANYYYNATGLKDQVEVYYDKTSDTYTPELDIDPNPTASGFIKVYPHQLKNLSDFITYWPADNSWAASLVKFHPEYKAYEYCQKEINSHAFDLAWSQAQTRAEFEAKYADVTDAYLFNPLGTSSSNAIDPYFNANNNELFTQREYDAMRNALDNYMTVGGHTYSLLEVAYATVHCPQFNAGPNGECRSDCFAGMNLSAMGDTEWKVFHAMYSGLKQRFQEQKSIVKSIAGEYYCGCIGEETWSPFTGDRLFYYTNSTPIIFAFHSQFFNIDQPCSWFRYKMFENKKPRAAKLNQAIPASELDAEQCYQNSDPNNVSSNGDFIQVDCPDQAQAQLDAMTERGNIEYFKTCGQCPATRDLSHLLDAITKKPGKLLSSNVALGCYPDGLAEWTPLLQQKSGIAVNTNSFVYNTSSTDNSSVYTATIGNGGASSCSIQLAFSPTYVVVDHSTNQEITLTSGTDIQWSDLTSLCCAQYIPSSTLVTSSTGHNFRIGATFNYTQQDGKVREVTILLEGYASCLILNDCEFSDCKTNPIAADLMNMFNALYYTESGVTEKFTSTDAVVISASNNEEYWALITDSLKKYGPALTATSNYVSQWTWQRTGLSSTTIDITVDVFENGNSTSVGDFGVHLVAPSTFDFTQIRRFMSIKPDTDYSDGKHFIIVAEKLDYTKVELKGSTTIYNIGTCTQYTYPLGN